MTAGEWLATQSAAPVETSLQVAVERLMRAIGGVAAEHLLKDRIGPLALAAVRILAAGVRQADLAEVHLLQQMPRRDQCHLGRGTPPTTKLSLQKSAYAFENPGALGSVSSSMHF